MEAERRRRRPAVSCTLCRRRKIRCDRETPCSNCIRSKNEACVYESHPPPQRQQPHAHEDGSSSISTASTAPDVEAMRGLINQLEETVRKATTSNTPANTTAVDANIEAQTTRLGGTFFIHHTTRATGGPTRSVSHKSRLFGQSHWMNYGVPLIADIGDLLDETVTKDASKLLRGIQRCKRLARTIKTQRSPGWPCSPTPDLPAKDIADALVACYLRTTETVYRVIHVPTFMRDYEALWIVGNVPDPAFLVLVKLAMAIGSATYDELYSLRPSAIRWVYEGEAWLSDPRRKAHLGIQYIQINILYLIAREAAAVAEDLVWISAGELFRSAVFVGLHRDPSRLPPRTPIAAEVHRRLWNTILELCLQSSLNSGGPPLVHLHDFDTEPPGNFDDEQLASEDPVAKAETDYTRVSVAIALRKTFPARLAVAHWLNHISSTESYEQTLKLDRELKASYKSLRRTLQDYDPRIGPSPSHFALRMVDVIMHRYILSLHMPFYAPALRSSTYAYSRKVALDTSLKIWYATNPASAVVATPSSVTPTSARGDDLERLTNCGTGFLRSGAMQALLVIGIDLKTQLLEEDSLGPAPVRRDLLAIVEDSLGWTLWQIEAGETNMKGHIFVCLMLAYVQALMRGARRDEIPSILVKEAEAGEERSFALLEKLLGAGGPDQASSELNQMSLDMAPDLIEGWEFMGAEAAGSAGNMDPMGWMFDQGDTQMSLLW